MHPEKNIYNLLILYAYRSSHTKTFLFLQSLMPNIFCPNWLWLSLMVAWALAWAVQALRVPSVCAMSLPSLTLMCSKLRLALVALRENLRGQFGSFILALFYHGLKLDRSDWNSTTNIAVRIKIVKGIWY